MDLGDKSEGTEGLDVTAKGLSLFELLDASSWVLVRYLELLQRARHLSLRFTLYSC